MSEKYDYLVIGSGPAGHVSAIRATQLGMKVAVVEKDEDMFGGVCLNEGCIPAKSLYNSAKIYDTIKNGQDLCGFDVQCGYVNMSKIIERSGKAAEDLRKGLSFLFKKNEIDLIKGSARFVNSETVEIKDAEGSVSSVNADRFLIATGSSPRQLENMPTDGRYIISSAQAIKLQEVPESVLIVGGGAIGTEFASFFNTVGSDVTVVEAMDALLPTEDNDVSRGMATSLKKKGVTVFTSSQVKNTKVGRDDVEVTIEGKAGGITERFVVIIMCVGRTPNTSGLGLENIGVETDDKGYIPVDSRMRTNAGNIYAAGDVLRGPMLAHLAYAEGEVAAETAGGNEVEPIDYSSVPNAVYTEVQAASVGITEEKAKDEGLTFSVGKQFFKACGKAIVSAKSEGFIKVIADNRTHRLLGVHILGSEAAELINEFVVAKKAGLTVEDIASTIHAHPTFSETAMDACKSVFSRPIHG